MAGPKSRIIQKGLGALGNIYDQLNLSRFGKGDKPYPEQEWDKAQGWQEYVRQLQLRDQALADKGALANLGDEPVDVGRREFMKGLATEGALAGVKGRAISKILDEVVSPIMEPVVETLPKSLIDLPSLKAIYKSIKEDNFRENLDLIANDADDADEAMELIHDAVEDSSKDFSDFGIDPDNIEFEDLFNEKLLKETNIVDNFADFDSLDLLRNEADDINRWINNEISLDDINEGAAPEVITDLMENYNLSKPQIGAYFKKQGII